MFYVRTYPNNEINLIVVKRLTITVLAKVEENAPYIENHLSENFPRKGLVVSSKLFDQVTNTRPPFLT
jgi:hypothetical protein